MKNTVINVTIKTVPHPNPQQAVDTFARIIVKELLVQGKQMKGAGQ